MINGKTICLAVPVYNEEKFLPALLESVTGIADALVVLDSESTDRSREIAANWCIDNDVRWHMELNKTIHRADHKRTKLMQLARQTGCDYILQIDADNTVEAIAEIVTVIHDVYSSDILDLDAYYITKQCGELSYDVLQLFRGDLDWKFTGIAHEYPELVEGEFTRGHLEGLIIHEAVKETGPRQRVPEHYYEHAVMIERELMQPDLDINLRNRYLFYLAQSWRDAGKIDRAIASYQERARAGGWYEEVWYSLYQVCKLQQKVTTDGNKVLMAAFECWNYLPQRREGAYMLMQILMMAGMFNVAYVVGQRTEELESAEILFREPEVCDRLFPDLYANLYKKIMGVSLTLSEK